jgi:hypothetical protein
MKRSEAANLIAEILHKTYSILTHEEEAELYSQDDALDILNMLEEKGILDESQFGSVCSRCDRKGWDQE